MQYQQAVDDTEIDFTLVWAMIQDILPGAQVTRDNERLVIDTGLEYTNREGKDGLPTLYGRIREWDIA